MRVPTLDDARSVKTEMIEKLKDIEGFAGAGIGEYKGQFSVRINWRVLPKDLCLPEKIGDVDVTHHEVGSLRPQAE